MNAYGFRETRRKLANASHGGLSYREWLLECQKLLRAAEFTEITYRAFRSATAAAMTQEQLSALDHATMQGWDAEATQFLGEGQP